MHRRARRQSIFLILFALTACSQSAALSDTPPKTLVLSLDAKPEPALVWIAPGHFRMGSPDSDGDANPDEKPQRDVAIAHGFYMARTTVTMAQFRSFVRATGYKTDAEADGTGGHGYNAKLNKFEGWFPQYTWKFSGWPLSDDHPVSNVSWNDAVQFCKWASEKSGHMVRLPTEAEWEYACRAGTTTRFFTGDDPASVEGYANVPDLALSRALGQAGDPSRFTFDDHYPFTSPVGSFKPNPWGLFDMIGNVWQWCADTFSDDPDKRVLRGGSYNLNIQTCRCAERGYGKPYSRYSYTGFRIVVER
jgi:sulfatase modifying factor 1